MAFYVYFLTCIIFSLTAVTWKFCPRYFPMKGFCIAFRRVIQGTLKCIQNVFSGWTNATDVTRPQQTHFAVDVC